MIIAKRLLTTQSVVVVTLALVWWVAVGGHDALAAAAGGACVLVPGWFFARKVASRGPGSSAGEMLGAFYRGAAIRFLMAAVLLFVLVPLFTDALLPFLSGLVAAIAVQWSAMLWKG